MPFQHVIVAYDGSPESQTALDRAADLVRSTPDSRLTVVHAFHFPTFVVGAAMVVAPVILSICGKSVTLSYQYSHQRHCCRSGPAR